jgi:hypothetical protein
MVQAWVGQKLLTAIVNSLPVIDAHERQFFDKLLWGLITSTIFVITRPMAASSGI